MRKKTQGRKGRPTIGKERKYSCSDEDYERIQAAAKLAGMKTAEFVRVSIIQVAAKILQQNES